MTPLLSLLLLVQDVTTASSIMLPAPFPAPVEAAADAYQDCLTGAIDAQDRTAHYSERRVLSACASVRRARLAEAMTSATGADTPFGRQIRKRFVELDDSVWTIVGHIRARHAGRN